ncbi:MAG: type ISP restriction/modification enzyme, partial [Desulfococcaceae bacterium]|nr:type ISP restriction/modification enzyme [Desulfococcaceae bacterium]
KISRCLYRPFDYRWILLDDIFVGYPRWETTKHFLFADSLGFATTRQTTKSIAILVGNIPFGQHKIVDSYDRSYIFPLYLYPENNEQQTFDNDTKRKPNLNDEIVQKIAESVNLTFTPEKEETKGTFAPIDILDYIYAVLHSPTYRETYKEFLKIDFPRVPYPRNQKIFWQMLEIGGELRTVHLLENPVVEQYITTYPKDGDNTVTRKITKKDFEITNKKSKTGRVWINDEQYFDGIPETAWEFYIGGYQPAQKWLKDRKGRQLNFEDILHYQKIIVALNQTDILMKKIDRIKFM